MLEKKNPHGVGWKQRAFVLDEEKKILWYYDPSKEGKILGTIYLPKVVTLFKTKGSDIGFQIHSDDRKFILRTTNEDTRDSWFEAALHCRSHSLSQITDFAKMIDISDENIEERTYESDSANPFAPILKKKGILLQGFLKKLSPSSFKGWQRRWFLVEGVHIYYQKNELNEEIDVTDTKNSISLALVQDVSVIKQEEFTFDIITEERIYHIQAYNKVEFTTWIKGLRAILESQKSGTPYNFQAVPITERKLFKTQYYDNDISQDLNEIVDPSFIPDHLDEVIHFKSNMSILIQNLKQENRIQPLGYIEATITKTPPPEWMNDTFKIVLHFNGFSGTNNIQLSLPVNIDQSLYNIVSNAINLEYQTLADTVGDNFFSEIENEVYTVRFIGKILYLLDLNIPIERYEQVREVLSSRKPLVLVVEPDSILRTEKAIPPEKTEQDMDSDETHTDIIGIERCYNVYFLKRPLEIYISQVEGMTLGHLKEIVRLDIPISNNNQGIDSIPKMNLPLFYITMELYFGGKSISPVFSTCYSRRGVWKQWIRTNIPLCELPRETRVYCTLWLRQNETDVAIGNAGWALFDFRGYFNRNAFSEPMWLDGEPNTLVSSSFNVSNEVMLLGRNCESDCPIAFPEDDGLLDSEEGQKSAFVSTYNVDIPHDQLEQLEELMSADPLVQMTNEQKQLTWQYRAFIQVYYPKLISKVMLSVDWRYHRSTSIAHNLLKSWPHLGPQYSLELLESTFSDSVVRKFSVKCLESVSDEELLLYLPQLVQVLKYENYEFNPLSQFLIKRALINRTLIGTHLFWSLLTEMNSVKTRARYALMIEALLHGADDQRDEILAQFRLITSLSNIAENVSKAQPSKKDEILSTELSILHIPTLFSLPIDPTYKFKGIIFDKCKYMDSNAAPLWLEFQNADDSGDNYAVIFKSGDDLRQDILTMQMFGIMDKLWKDEGLDLGMNLYKVVATGYNVGMIQVVKNSKTIAKIQKEAGGATKVFNKKPLKNWLESMNPDPEQMNSAVDAFVRSSAAYCVATYVIGIGDRHNDNIMVTDTGYLFHIDFGHFLGNIMKFGFYNREQAPFVFTPDFAYVMGDTTGEAFQRFLQISRRAYLIVRASARIFLSLFHLMLSTGIPQLKTAEDLKYLKVAFALNMTDEEAENYFEKLIFVSLKDPSTLLNFFAHNLVH
eukprot:TRINITY_DN2937_c0_g1_i3.p1 TRINITY_DN2937_c0_g1~~TRINITY_DN2937_c0_g1_i3.p1  ORF type:complete len:1179 (-),score=257.23 TRINITY_DN2937_c0_g1_i3:21-3557(-)